MQEKSRKPTKTHKAKLSFITSAADFRGCPSGDLPEVALAGRSNAGKSSFLNGLAEARIAKVSGTPGKTRLLNFFQVGEGYRLVDMPGYGYAAVGRGEQRSWRKMIESYLSLRSNLVGLLLLMDIRRDWTDDEQMLVDWMRPIDRPVALVLTKIDKVSKSEFLSRSKMLQNKSGIETVFGTSSLKKTGFSEVEEFVFNQWVKPRLD